ncbi:MAG: hypothetical protein QXP36_15265 [Conexivisphaerales archaeon]
MGSKILLCCFHTLVKGIEDLEKVLETPENEEVNYIGKKILLTVVRNQGGPFGVFYLGAYGFLRPKGRIVVNIGARIGDSAIYFVQHGADRAMAYKLFQSCTILYPPTFERMASTKK